MSLIDRYYEWRMRRIYMRLHSAIGDVSVNGGPEEAYQMRRLLAQWFDRVCR